MASFFKSGHKAKSQRNGYGLDGNVGKCCRFQSEKIPQPGHTALPLRGGSVGSFLALFHHRCVTTAAVSAGGVGIVFKSGPDEALFVKVSEAKARFSPRSVVRG